MDGIKSIKIKCADVSCRFEFVAYRFKGKDRYVPKAAIVEGPPQSIIMPQSPAVFFSPSNELSPQRNGDVRSDISEERGSLVANGVGKHRSARDTSSTTVSLDVTTASEV